MIRLAIIGTNWITDEFVKAALATQRYELIAVYSRELDKARSFGEKYNVKHYFDSLDALANADFVDAVYIASPNSLHQPQSKLMLMHGKHVICEKPFASNFDEAKAVIDIAKEHQRVFMEAMKVYYLPNFALIKDKLPELGKLRKVFLNYCQYSSRYPKYLAGELPNTFNPQFSNGSLMDIGIYPLSFAIALWGKPKKVQANAGMLASGVDGHGTLLLSYGDFDITIWHSKVSDGCIPSEIQGEEGSLLVEHLSIAEKVCYIKRKESVVDITLPQVDNTMFYEAQHFADLIASNTIEHPDLQVSLDVAEVMTEARRQIGIVFPADQV